MSFSEFVTQVTTAALSGAVAASIVNWLRAEWSDRATRGATYVTEQLKHLYGPLNYYASQNENIVEVHSRISNAYEEEYVQTEFSDNPATEASVDKQTTTTINLSNAYGAQLAANNDRMVEIIRDNYGLIDPDDAELLQAFATHSLRCKLEAGETAPPFRVRLHLGSANLYHSGFINAIHEQFDAKKLELDRLRRLPRWKFWAKRPTTSVREKMEIVVPHSLLSQHRETAKAQKEKREEIRRARESP